MLDKMKLLQFTTKKTVTIEMNLFERAKYDPYEFILGRNLLLDVKSSTRTFAWDEIETRMVSRGHWNITAIGSFWKVDVDNDNREQKFTNYSEDIRANVEMLVANYIKPNIEKIAYE